jgi:hypothetical protein
MAPKALTAFRIDPTVMEGLRRVKDRDGVPLSIQVDRALRAWLAKQKISVKPAPLASKAGRKPSRRTPR